MTNVLIIDDDEHLARSVGRALAGHGCEVRVARNLQEARQKIDGADVVLSDWDLGIFDPLDGGQIVAALREDYPGLRYVIWSGLHREVPDDVEFFLKGSIADVIDALSDESRYT